MIDPPKGVFNEGQNASRTISNPVRVLLLDDEPANLSLSAVVLHRHGYQCVCASTPEEAIEQFDNIDIAVLDYPGLGEYGTEVAALLRDRRPHVPIIILSATLDRFFGVPRLCICSRVTAPSKSTWTPSALLKLTAVAPPP